MVNGPQQAFLAESFSARVRTTSTGTIFNVANGFIAGFLPFGAFWLSSVTGNPYMAWPIFFAVLAVIVNVLFLRETYKTKIWDEVAQTSKA